MITWRKCTLMETSYLEKWIIDLVNRNSCISISIHAKNKQKEYFLSCFPS